MISDIIYVAKIAQSTSVDGVGLRNALYVSGCPIHCPECHNKDWWEMESGIPMDIDDVVAELAQDGFNISILGGEPLGQFEAVLELCRRFKECYPDRTIWMWTGYTMEHVTQHYSEILEYIDTLVDGPFVVSLKDTSLHFRGSSNQRIIDVKKHNIEIC